MVGDENPGLIFDGDDGDPFTTSDIPVVLLHDGGGTCFAYYCLNPLNRPTYEIHNPHFENGKPWPGGIPEMAQHYVDLMRKVVPQGQILLGGWSLGGILSLEMARILANDDMYHVLGIAMVDSICPDAPLARARLGDKRIVAFEGEFGPQTKQETIERVTQCFSEARRAVGLYQLPVWDDDDDNNNNNQACENGVKNGEDQLDVEKHASSKIVCPPVILLRAKETVPVESGAVSFVDYVRDDRSLGWDEYRKGFLTQIIDIPGHHFNIFSWDHIDTISEKLIYALTKLEILSKTNTSTSR